MEEYGKGDGQERLNEFELMASEPDPELEGDEPLALPAGRGVDVRKEAGMPPDTRLFNSGVLLMDLAVWREHARCRCAAERSPSSGIRSPCSSAICTIAKL